MFENLGNFFKKMVKTENRELGSKDDAKERLHLVLMQDRANVSADFLELMKQEIIDVIKKYIVVDEASIDVRLTNKTNEDGTTGAPALYANIPIVNIKNDMKAEKINEIREIEKSRLENSEKNKEVAEESETVVETKVEENVNQVSSENETVKEAESVENNNTINNDDNLKKVEENKSDLENTSNEEIQKEEKNESKSVNNNNNNHKNNKKNNKKNNSKKNVNNDRNNIPKPNMELEDEEDDGKDVTFDELLKAAEEDIKKSEGNS